MITVDTMQIPGGAVDLDDDGGFVELRMSGGARVRRVSPRELVIESEGGMAFTVRAPGRIDVDMGIGMQAWAAEERG